MIELIAPTSISEDAISLIKKARIGVLQAKKIPSVLKTSAMLYWEIRIQPETVEEEINKFSYLGMELIEDNTLPDNVFLISMI